MRLPDEGCCCHRENWWKSWYIRLLVSIRGFIEPNSLGESSSLKPWRERQSEGVIHVWRFGEKILQDRGTIATLEIEIGAVLVREPIFLGLA